MISFGAGKQSTYMMIRALEGDFGTRPDFAVFSDTGCEPQYVYSFMEWFVPYIKETYSFDIIIVTAGDIKQDTLDFVQGKKGRVAALPLRLWPDGGLLMRQCTMDYKIAPLRRHLQKVRERGKIKLWIGISFDERERAKDSPVKYIQHYYPLVDYRIGIDTIRAWYDSTGFQQPAKSACLICPFHSKQYWQVFKKNYPQEFEEACEFDDAIRNFPGLRSQAFLYKDAHRGLIPLRDVDFTQAPSLFPELIEECYGFCGL